MSRDAELISLLTLNMTPGIGPRLQTELLECFGSPAAALAAGENELLRVKGIGRKLARAIVENRNLEAAERELQRCRELNVRLIVRGAPDYPPLLNELPDAPPVLYVRGTLLEQDQLGVALVGSRHCTLYGQRQSERFASVLARAGLTIISGLARGIDSAAHRGALEAGGRTLAICATGLAEMYPPEHEDLAEEIVENGAVISESPLDQKPLAGLFPQRNRIISGMSLGVVIVEAARKSGALYTARHAMEQGREVFAVPGRLDSPKSEGCHDLIRDGVTLVRGPDDVLEALGPLMQPIMRSASAASQPTGGESSGTETPGRYGGPGNSETILVPRELTLNDQERSLLQLIGLEPRPVDEVLRLTTLETSRALSTLTILEMKRLVRRLPGNFVVRGPQ